MDGATLSGINAQTFAGNASAATYPRDANSMRDVFERAFSFPNTGIFAVGQMQRRVNQTSWCRLWNFTEETHGVEGLGGVIVKYTPQLELPTVRG